MEDRKVMLTRNGKMIYEPGTIHKTTDGKRYVVAPDGGWRRLDKLREKLREEKKEKIWK